MVAPRHSWSENGRRNLTASVTSPGAGRSMEQPLATESWGRAAFIMACGARHLFQQNQPRSSSALVSLPMMPEWYLLVIALTALTAVTAMGWVRPLLWLARAGSAAGGPVCVDAGDRARLSMHTANGSIRISNDSPCGRRLRFSTACNRSPARWADTHADSPRGGSGHSTVSNCLFQANFKSARRNGSSRINGSSWRQSN